MDFYSKQKQSSSFSFVWHFLWFLSLRQNITNLIYVLFTNPTVGWRFFRGLLFSFRVYSSCYRPRRYYQDLTSIKLNMNAIKTQPYIKGDFEWSRKFNNATTYLGRRRVSTYSTPTKQGFEIHNKLSKKYIARLSDRAFWCVYNKRALVCLLD